MTKGQEWSPIGHHIIIYRAEAQENLKDGLVFTVKKSDYSGNNNIVSRQKRKYDESIILETLKITDLYTAEFALIVCTVTCNNYAQPDRLHVC